MILLGANRGYNGYAAATIIQAQTQTEAALVAQGLATVSAGPVTAGAVSVTAAVTSGRVGIAASGTSVTITNPAFTTESKFSVNLSNAAADTTATSFRVTPAAGSVTITLNAASTGIVALDWALLLLGGEVPGPTQP